jgi:hypothetical protein
MSFNLAREVKELRNHPDLNRPGLPFDTGEPKAEFMLAARHLEDAGLRMLMALKALEALREVE